MRSERNFILKCVFGLALMCSILFSSCAFLFGTNKPVIPNGLSVNENNCTYIKGPILAVNGNAVSRSLLTEPNIIIPAGEELKITVDIGVGVYTAQNKKSYNFSTNQEITLPPLEKNRNYHLTISTNDDLNEKLLLTDCTISVSDITDILNGTDRRTGFIIVFNESRSFNPPIRPR